jgi:hypothetical protein
MFLRVHNISYIIPRCFNSQQKIPVRSKNNIKCVTEYNRLKEGRRQSCPCAQLIKYYAMETYGGMDSLDLHYLKVSGQLHAHAASPPGKELVAVWGPQPFWTNWRRENSWPHRDSNSDFSVVQLVAVRYTDCAILAPNHLKETRKYLL